MAGREEDWWGPENVEYSFTAWAYCKSCGEKVALAGTGGVEQEYDEHGDVDYLNLFQLRYCHPTLQLIQLPKMCPPTIDVALQASFGLYWSDRPSSAGRIRVALERLLDHLGVSSTTPAGGFVKLDKRIDDFSKGDPVNGAQLMALKWLGNLGSHTADVDRQDLLSAFEVMEHVLSELIANKSASILKLAADLTAKYGTKPPPAAPL